jgi:hypothetical protein
MSNISPDHYKNANWEAIEIIEAVVIQMIRAGHAPDAAYNVGASLKYLLRTGRKGEALEQVQKAEWHIRRAVNMLARQPNFESDVDYKDSPDLD